MKNYYQKRDFKDNGIEETSFVNYTSQVELPLTSFRLFGYSESRIRPGSSLTFGIANNNFFTLEYIYRGRGRFITPTQSYLARSSMIMLYNGVNRDKIQLVADENEFIEKRGVMICRDPFSEYMMGFFQEDEIEFIRINHPERIMNIFSRFRNLVEHDSEFQHKDLSDLCYSCLNEMNSFRNTGNESDDFFRIVNALRRFPQRYKNINILMDDLKINRSALFQLFKKHFDTSPMDFIIKQRINNSCWQLKNQTMPINAIAQLYGYKNPEFFTRQFKQLMGMSPTEYRKWNKVDNFQKSSTFVPRTLGEK